MFVSSVRKFLLSKSRISSLSLHGVLLGIEGAYTWGWRVQVGDV